MLSGSYEYLRGSKTSWSPQLIDKEDNIPNPLGASGDCKITLSMRF